MYGTVMRLSFQSSGGDNLDNIREITEPIFTWYMKYVFVIMRDDYKCNWLQKSENIQTKG